jgi:mono/diheme cytochrome c family protein
MAATDQTYRHQKTLDIVFAVSCVLMLVSIIWMFADDYNREFKHVQREFRDVDDALTQRAMLERLPKVEEVDAASATVTSARREFDQIKAENQGKLRGLLADKAHWEAEAQSNKADLDSVTSLYNIAVEHRDAAADPKRRESLQVVVDRRKSEVDSLEKKLSDAQNRLDQTQKELKEKQANQTAAQKAVSAADDQLKKVSGDFDRFAKAVAQKRWKPGDTIRNLPVLDAFAAPTKIQQFTLTEYPIDYYFKSVTRFDRCMTCHLGIDLPNFDKEALRKLDAGKSTDGLQEKLDQARDLLRARVAKGEDLGFDPGDLPKKVVTVDLTEAQVNEYCVHPRLDLFVSGNSPHPAEKFGCTVCHAGQGSATDFLNAAHMANDAAQKGKWIDRYKWTPSHFWDFPMLPERFIESSCLKCHRQVTDLADEARRLDIRDGKPASGPGAKLFQGYLLVRESGCFGCHEIAGIKGSQEVGPDLRLEPSPPLEAYTPAEQAKMLSDPLNPPGTMRKVGPSLYRIIEKTNQRWVRRWIQSPRGFRPSTKMPHFYGLSNNDSEALPPEQKGFPDAEIHAIGHYLFTESKDYLKGEDRYRAATKARIKEIEEKKQNGLAGEQELRLLEELTRRLAIDKPPVPIAKRMIDSQGNTVTLPPAPSDKKAQDEQLKRGRQLFSERGCLACHSHQATTRPAPDVPAATGEAIFGPDLTRLAAKIAPEAEDGEAKRRWLVQWILDPHVHSPRTRMPVTHLDVNQASDVAAWLLSCGTEGWDSEADVAAPSAEVLEQLARAYLLKAPGMTRQDVDDILRPIEGGKRQGLAEVQQLPIDADERALASPLDDNHLKWYIARKAITRLGCFGCHDIPGFSMSKPIGTPLNDWGKKDPERLAFEDIVPYVEENYHLVDQLKDDAGRGLKGEGKKPPYERFFFELLAHHQREGFLHQKLIEPRSFDFDRRRTWDDRLRMPQFKFAHANVKPLEGETQEQAEAREEADAREAVMTFILGLVAEPVPAKYLYSPAPDRLAEVKGRQVLEKYNCAGCHEIRSGRYEFKNSQAMTQRLNEGYDSAKANTFASDHPLLGLDHNAWFSQPPKKADSLTAFGVPNPDNDDPKLISLRLTEALRFMAADKEVRDIPAASTIGIPVDELLSRSEPHGGTFVDLLIPYLAKKDPLLYKEYKNARAALPPPLLREGEKAQPEWLFRFLKNPFEVRPVTVLRMPRFNMSDDEAMTLVNYFAAVDRRNNPGEGLHYPYIPVPQRDDRFWQEQTEKYITRLGKQRVEERLRSLQPTWEFLLQQRVGETDRKLQSAEAAIKTAKEDERNAAIALRDSLKKELEEYKAQAAKKDYMALNRSWVERDAYAADAYRLLANYNTPCLSCHQVANLPPKQPQGPSLNLSAERLRPEWTMRWVANPDRMISYPTPMPQNFASNQVDSKGFSSLYPEFLGTPAEQVVAVRDILLALPKIADMPVNRYYRPPAGGEGGGR